MSWYKKAQSYIDIGHTGDYILWYSPDGIDVIKSKVNEISTHSAWGKVKIKNQAYAGRYDINKQLISAVGYAYQDIPQSLVNNLLRAFPDARALYMFTGFRTTPEVLRVASKIRLASEDDVIDTYYQMKSEVLHEFIKNPRGKQPWRVIPAGRLKKIWKDYATYGVIRDIQGLDEIATHMINNIMKLQVNTELAGHSMTQPKEIYEEVGIRYTEKRDDMFGDYILDQNGQWRISDYGLPKLMDLVFKLGNATDSREKLLIIDQMLNVFHQRSDLPAMFVEGGGVTLDELYENPEEKEKIEKVRDEEYKAKPSPVKSKKQLEFEMSCSTGWYKRATVCIAAKPKRNKWDGPYSDPLDDIIEIAGMTSPNGESISDYVTEESNVSPHEKLSAQGETASKIFVNPDTQHWYFSLLSNKLSWANYTTKPSQFIREMAAVHIRRKYKLEVRGEEMQYERSRISY